jgi:hypothetical protein
MTHKFEDDDKARARDLQRVLNEMLKPLSPLLDLKAGKEDEVEVIDRMIKALPPGETFARAVEELRQKASAFLNESKRSRQAAFREIEAAFIRQVQTAGLPIQELGQSWRIGPIELKFRRELAQAQAFYNHQPLGKWTSIASLGDLQALFDGANANLEAAAIPLDILANAFWAAFRYARSQLSRPGVDRADMVPAREFYREVMVALYRDSLLRTKGQKAPIPELPEWAFLYNVDRYRSFLPSVPPDRRLAFQMGSQLDQSKGMGITVNGLDAREEYRVYCYVVQAGER